MAKRLSKRELTTIFGEWTIGGIKACETVTYTQKNIEKIINAIVKAQKKNET